MKTILKLAVSMSRTINNKTSSCTNRNLHSSRTNILGASTMSIKNNSYASRCWRSKWECSDL